MARLCVWIRKDTRDMFVKLVKMRHGIDKGGTRMELERMIGEFIRNNERGRRTYHSNNNMNKLLDLALELETYHEYPKITRDVLMGTVKKVIGKDRRTIKKYAEMVQSKSARLPNNWIVTWDVSNFVNGVYHCNRNGLDPASMVGGK